MKRLLIILLSLAFFQVGSVFAEVGATWNGSDNAYGPAVEQDTEFGDLDSAIEAQSASDSTTTTSTPTPSRTTSVTITEYIPGIAGSERCTGSPAARKCKVTIESGLGTVKTLLGGLIRYATFITALIGVLMLVVSGVQYSMAGIDSHAKDGAKHRIEQVITGLIVLFLIGFILNTIAPWIYGWSSGTTASVDGSAASVSSSTPASDSVTNGNNAEDARLLRQNNIGNSDASGGNPGSGNVPTIDTNATNNSASTGNQ